MVFTTTNLFKGIACPEGEQCQLTNCIYAHNSTPSSGESERAAAIDPGLREEPAPKRRKFTAEDSTGRPLSKSDQVREQLVAHRKHSPGPHSLAPQVPPSLERPVTPPPANARKATISNTSSRAAKDLDDASTSTKKTSFETKEALNPRRIPNDPAGHQKRTLYIKYMHMDMVRLNKKVADAAGLPNNKLLHLSDQEIIKLALDEEESLARSQGTLYTNKMKQRVATYKKMDLPGWIEHVKLTVIQPKTNKDETKRPDPDEKVIDTGLSPDEEVLILPHLVADQTELAEHGYIPTPPTEAEAAEAQAAVEASKNYENCDRCDARFQVFPERNDQGLLTSNGPCKFHANKPIQPQKTKNDFHVGAKERYHPCCNGVVGSAGCTTHESHVFKCSAPARLAAVLPFITTPENPSPAKGKDGKEVKAVSFDCEMGYTTCGLELIRLTAVGWPSGDELVDVLVRPVGTIIDLNSRFSGVFPEHFAHAVPYEDWPSYIPPPPEPNRTTNPSDVPQVLPIVQSITSARAILCSYLTPTTPLIGHAIDNDLNTTRLCHPTIIDTVLLFRHPRGLPYRWGLRALALQHLGKKIQQGGERGHDSAEDARATGDLVRVKVGERWGQLRRAGWIIEDGKMGRRGADGEFVELGEGEEGSQAREMVQRALNGGGGGGGGGGSRKRGKKRSKGQAFGMDGAADEDEEGEGSASTEKEDGSGEGSGNGLKSFLDRA